MDDRTKPPSIGEVNRRVLEHLGVRLPRSEKPVAPRTVAQVVAAIVEATKGEVLGSNILIDNTVMVTVRPARADDYWPC